MDWNGSDRGGSADADDTGVLAVTRSRHREGMSTLETYRSLTPAATFILRAKTRTMLEAYDASSDPYWSIDEAIWARDVWSAEKAGLLLVEPKKVAESAHLARIHR